jgi:hypothetical protein
MPEAFLQCIRNGGRVFTVNIGKNKYRHGCEIKGKIYYGEIKKEKSKK